MPKASWHGEIQREVDLQELGSLSQVTSSMLLEMCEMDLDGWEDLQDRQIM